LINKNKVQICVVGWHYFSDFYKKLRKCKYKAYIVAHRYNDILDRMKFDYTVTKNIGLEYGAYNWFIGNIWDGESGVLLSHDDTSVSNVSVLDSMLDRCRKYDRVYITGRTKSKKQKYSTRCIYLSGKLIKRYLKEFGEIWYDKYNKGYTLCQKVAHDDKYDNKNDAASKFKVSLNSLCKKNNFKTLEYNSKDLVFYRRGIDGKLDKKQFNDNSIFGRETDISLEELAVKHKSIKRRDLNYYTKWYQFYFNSMRLDNLNILDIGEDSSNSIKIWKDYFKNSEVYSKDSGNIKNGFDIIIDSGNSNVEEFQSRFKRLNPSGVYVVENLQNYYQEKLLTDVIDYLKGIVDDVNFHGRFNINNIEKIYQKNVKLNYCEENIYSVCFYPGICFIFKR